MCLRVFVCSSVGVSAFLRFFVSLGLTILFVLYFYLCDLKWLNDAFCINLRSRKKWKWGRDAVHFFWV